MVVCFVLTFNACDRNNLVSVTAKDVLDIAKFEKGKRAVLINVWATWWSSCVAEFPFIRDLENKYKDDLNVIFVSGDWLEQEEDYVSEWTDWEGVDMNELLNIHKVCILNKTQYAGSLSLNDKAHKVIDSQEWNR